MYSPRKEQDVWIQDQATPPFQYYLMNEVKADITLTGDITKGDTVINVSAGHGFATGATPPHYMVVQEGSLYVQSKVTGVAVNAITIAIPAGSAFTSGGSTIIRGAIDMDVDGTVPVTYQCNLRAGIPVDIQHTHITIWNVAAAGDDGDFGDLGILTNGLRLYKENSIDQNLGNYHTNSDFREYGAEVNYTDKSGGGGNFGVNCCFDIKKVYGVVLRITPGIDIMKATIQDDLHTLTRLRISLMGQFTQGE